MSMSDACICCSSCIGCRSMMVLDGSAARNPFFPAARSIAASPNAVPTQSEWIAGLTYIMTS